MAQAKSLLDEDQFSCTICLSLLNDPVAIPCGHSYCTGCIKGYWDQNDQTGVYRCPQCRQTFNPRPVLGRNTMLAAVVEKLKKTRLVAPRVLRSSNSGTHFQPHNESPTLMKHKLDKATGNLQKKICSHHDKALEIYCRTDEQFICYLCTIENHRGHDTVSAATKRTEKQKQLEATQSKVQQRIQEREKELLDLRQALRSLQRSAQAAVEDSDRIFKEMIRSIEKRCTEVKELIRDQEKAAVGRAEELLERLQQQIAELRRRDAEQEQLSHTEDHVYFLRNCQPLCVPPGPGDLASITFNPNSSFKVASKTVAELKEQLEYFCNGGIIKITESVKEVDIVPVPQPTVRNEFLQCYCNLTLDPNTASSLLSLSKGNREVTYVKGSPSYPEHPARFDSWEQVLCREGLSGRHYWEVEWKGKGDVYIAVCYEGMMRKGQGHNALFGYNDKSWSLWCSESKCYFYHNKKYKTFPAPTTTRIGVYLDHRAGTLSFHSVSDTMTLLHRVKTTFTQPLYPGFYVNTAGSSITLCSVG